MTNRTRSAVAAVCCLALAGCAPALCTTDAACQGSRSSLYDQEPLTEAQLDSLQQERVG